MARRVVSPPAKSSLSLNTELPTLRLYAPHSHSLTPKPRPSPPDPVTYVHQNSPQRLHLSRKLRAPSETPKVKKHLYASIEDSLRTESLYGLCSMKPHLYILKTLKRQYTIEREGTPRPLQFNKFFERLADNMKRFTRNEPKKKLEDDEDLKDAIVIKSKQEAQILTSKDAFIRTAEIEQHAWMRRRKMEIREEDQVTGCIHALFELIDSKRVGSIEGTEFVTQLLSLGLTNDPITIVKLLKMSFGEDIATLQLTKNDLLKFCKGNRRIDHILTILTKSIQKPHLTPEPNSESKSSHSPRRAPNYPTLTEYLDLIKNYWLEMDRDIRECVKKEQVQAKLLTHRFAPDILEAKKMVSGSGESVSFDQFQALFARCILKGALIALDQKLLQLTPAPGGFSTALKISTYKRRLLLAGLDSRHRSLQSQQQGATAIRALELFHQMQLSPSTVRYLLDSPRREPGTK